MSQRREYKLSVVKKVVGARAANLHNTEAVDWLRGSPEPSSRHDLSRS